jgi:hypothetical protein
MSPACISNCADCGIGTITAGEWFMVHNHVWEQAWAGRRKSWQRRVPGQEILCIGCLERRIGRTLTRHDITHASSPISDRLRDRLTTQTNAPIGAKLTEGQNDGMDELTLLAVAEAIKAEAGVTHHRIVDPRREDGRVIFGLAFPQRKIIHAPEGRTPKDLYLLAHECAHRALISRGWKSRRGFATPGLVQRLSNFTYPIDRPRGDWPLARPEFTRNCQQFQNPPLRCGEITSRLCAFSPRGDSASGVADTSSAISY